MESILNKTVTLNNGIKMPMMGFGTWMMTDEQAAVAVREALHAGYRLIDTAAFYNCERGVGQGIRDSGIPREEIFVTTKVWPTDLYENTTERAYKESLERLGLAFIDLWLLHWPVSYVNGWKVMEQIYRDGRVRAIGVSNFRVKQLMTLLDSCETVPAFLQMECNPLVTNYEVRALCEYKGIAVGGWQSLGSGPKGELLTNEVILELAERYGKTPAQVCLRWAYQLGIVTVPKTVTPSRMIENAGILDFVLSAQDLEMIGQLRQLPRYDTEIRDVPIRITEQVERGIRFAEKGYQGNLTAGFYSKQS